MRRIEHVLAGLISGSAGRLLAFVIDFAAALARGLRGDPRHPEERGATRKSSG
ncbi:MAG: hypothetical protein ABIZ50_00430 [Solirubrobacterales bacterium]